MLNFKKYLSLSLLTLTPLLASAQIQTPEAGASVPGVPSGSYRGHFRGQEKGIVHFMSQPIRGCDACFIATIFKNERSFLGAGKPGRKVKTYKALPLNVVGTPKGQASASEYALVPLGVDTDGEITTPNANPSMKLTIGAYAGTNDVKFVLSDAGSDNADPFATAMNFDDGEGDPFEIDDGESGNLKSFELFTRATATIGMFSVSQEDLITRFATITSFGSKKEKSGTFQVEEKAPGLFTYSQVGYFAWGENVAEYPRKLIIFMEHRNGDRALLVDPKNPSDIQYLRVTR